MMDMKKPADKISINMTTGIKNELTLEIKMFG